MNDKQNYQESPNLHCETDICPDCDDTGCPSCCSFGEFTPGTEECDFCSNHNACREIWVASFRDATPHVLQDHISHITLINGLKFDNQLLNDLTTCMPIGELFTILKRDDTITVKKIYPFEIDEWHNEFKEKLIRGVMCDDWTGFLFQKIIGENNTGGTL